MDIRSAGFTNSDLGKVERASGSGSREPARMLPELLDQVSPEQEIISVTADRTFGTRPCHCFGAYVAQSGATVLHCT